MAITTLPPAEGTGLTHDEVRQKINEVILGINALGIRSFGIVDYNDAATAVTPIQVLAGSPTTLTNDAAGPQTTKDFLPDGVTDIWNASTNQFDLSELSMGSHIEVRVELKVTTLTPNTAIRAYVVMGIGSGFEFEVPYSNGLYKAVTTNADISRFNGFYVGSEVVRDYPAEIRVVADEDCEITVVGWYCTVSTR